MPKHLWLPTNHTNNTVSFEIQTIEEGEGKALVKYVQKFSSSSDVCEACGIKNKIIIIFIPAE